MGKLFGTDGVRGVANTELTPELAFKLGKAGALVLSKSSTKPTFIIGKDTRLSGDMLEDALSAGILSVGGNVIKAGIIPTPGIAYLVQEENADAGVVISASHNPFEYNGIKFFNGSGFKLDDAIEDEIERLIESDKDMESTVIGADLGRMVDYAGNELKTYANYLIESADADISSFKVVVDCANGASYEVAQLVFEGLGVDATFIGNDPDGININDNIGSTHPELLQETVKKVGADIGLAYDGDADRLIAVDETGEIINGDQIMYICAAQLKKEGKLNNNLVTATVMSNIGLGMALEEEGIKLQQSAVGDRYVLEMMQQTGSVIGGEQSGHLIFLDKNTTGDGVYASLKLLSAIKLSGKKASELANQVTVYPQVLVNAKVKNENKQAYKEDDEILKSIEEIENKMAGKGRVLIRPSGTEPLVRVMLEGDDYEGMKAMASELAERITNKLG